MHFFGTVILALSVCARVFLYLATHVRGHCVHTVENCHATDGPPKTGPPGPFMAAAAGPPGPFVALQVVPPDQLWHHGWSPFAMVGPPSGP